MSLTHKQLFKQIEDRKKISAMTATIKLNKHLRQERGEIILDAVCTVFETTKKDVCGRSRLRHCTEPRHAYIYLYNMLSPRVSLTEIGRRLGRDHSTVINSIRRCQDLIQSDASYAEKVGEVVKMLQASHPWLVDDGKKKLKSKRTWTQYQLTSAANLTLDFINAWDTYIETGDANEFMSNCTIIRLHAMGLDRATLNDPPITIKPQFQL